MKTKEERIVELLNSKGLTIREAFEEGAKFGYDLAMQWRDPKVELPSYDEMVVIKVFTSNGSKYYAVAKLFEDDEGIVYFNVVAHALFLIRIEDNVFWRPIE